jgi:Na+-driven multidrug efflux pump
MTDTIMVGSLGEVSLSAAALAGQIFFVLMILNFGLGGGDTKFLMISDVLFLWIISIPLGFFAGLVWGLPPAIVYLCLKIDEILECIWCGFRLFSDKWITDITVGDNIKLEAAD